MKYDDMNKSRGTLMLLALIVLLVSRFLSAEVQAVNPWSDAQPYTVPGYQLEREEHDHHHPGWETEAGRG